MKKSRKLQILSFSLFQALLLTLLGLVCGIFYSFGGLIIDLLVTMEILSPERMKTPGLSFGTLLAFGALIGMPVIFGVLGFFAGMLEAIIFNLFAGWLNRLVPNFDIWK